MTTGLIPITFAGAAPAVSISKEPLRSETSLLAF
jgi:hypothetical protein